MVRATRRMRAAPRPVSLRAAAHRAPQRRASGGNGTSSSSAPPAMWLLRRHGVAASRCSCRSTAASTCAAHGRGRRAGSPASGSPIPRAGGRTGRAAAPTAAAGTARAARRCSGTPALDPPARARVAARDQQEVGRELDGARRPADAHDALLERLAQRFEHARAGTRPARRGRATPRCASVISPGRTRGLPPPTSATVDALWCGARNGRARTQTRGGARAPAAEWILRDFERLVACRAAAGSSAAGGRASSCRRRAARRAAGGATAGGRDGEGAARVREAVHVGEVERARRSDGSGRRRRRVRGRRATGISPFRHACSSPSERATRTSTPGTSAASAALAAGTIDAAHAGARERVDERERAVHRTARARRARARRARRAVEDARRQSLVGAGERRARRRARARSRSCARRPVRGSR